MLRITTTHHCHIIGASCLITAVSLVQGPNIQAFFVCMLIYTNSTTTAHTTVLDIKLKSIGML